MGFIMDGLDAEAYDRQYSDRDLVRRILAYFRPEGWRIGVVALAIFLTSLVNTALPVVISNGLDELGLTSPTPEVLIRLMLIVTALGVLGWTFNAFRQWLSAAAIGNVTLRLREDAFDAVTKRDMSFYDQFPSAKIVSRVTSDTQQFSQTVGLVTDLMSQFLLVVLLVGYLFSVNVTMALITLALAPFIVVTALAFRKIARSTITQSRRVNAEVSSHIQETVSGIRIAKAFRQEQAIYDDFLDVNARSYRINLRTGYTFSSIFPILNMVAGIGTAALVFFGGRIAIDSPNLLTPGQWYLFIQGLALFWFPLTSIASFWSQFQLGLAAGERVFALIDAEPKVVQTANRMLDRINGEIEFKNLDFGYVDGQPVLSDFNLHIRQGESLALVGHTGSGKSSLGKLVARFYEFQGGDITVDGISLRTVNLDSYRSKLGIVTQTPFLFDGTVRENIRYGRASATDEEVETAAMQVANGDWLSVLAQGLDTPVGERGSALSMGQRQLVCLARVVLQDPAIFILDEATASVDPLTEALIQEGLDTVMKGRTSIVIAHRLSTIKNSDRIIVLRKGEIIEQGTHDELIGNDGHYAELYNTYFRHQSLEYIESAKDMVA
ncbi:MAG: ABC transporter ATP-binding protein [Chloroflexi bacterium]|nr:ABC transporter ATP-binding protein [Chloroflexota bacterium]